MSKRTTHSLLAAALVLLAACTSSPDTPQEPAVTRTIERSTSGRFRQSDSQTIEAEGIVSDINYETREVSVLNSFGTLTSVTAGPEITRFHEIKKGDKVRVKYVESLGLEVLPRAGSPASAVSGSKVAIKKHGEDVPPGLEAAARTNTVVTVRSINLGAETVELELPDGGRAAVKVRYPENLSRIKPGDRIAVSYREALAVAIDPA